MFPAQRENQTSQLVSELPGSKQTKKGQLKRKDTKQEQNQQPGVGDC
jgi:hypothetical protein